jgi:hypothetical protein
MSWGTCWKFLHARTSCYGTTSYIFVTQKLRDNGCFQIKHIPDGVGMPQLQADYPRKKLPKKWRADLRLLDKCAEPCCGCAHQLCFPSFSVPGGGAWIHARASLGAPELDHRERLRHVSRCLARPTRLRFNNTVMSSRAGQGLLPGMVPPGHIRWWRIPVPRRSYERGHAHGHPQVCR